MEVLYIDLDFHIELDVEQLGVRSKHWPSTILIHFIIDMNRLDGGLNREI